MVFADSERWCNVRYRTDRRGSRVQTSFIVSRRLATFLPSARSSATGRSSIAAAREIRYHSAISRERTGLNQVQQDGKLNLKTDAQAQQDVTPALK